MKPKDLPLFRDPEAKKVLSDACRKHGITLGLLQQLLEVQRSYSGSGRAMGITADFDAIISDFVESQEVPEEQAARSAARGR